MRNWDTFDPLFSLRLGARCFLIMNGLKDEKVAQSSEYAGTSRIVAGAGVNFISSVASVAIGFGFNILISRILPVSELGLYTYGATIALLLYFLSMLGLDIGLWRFISAFNVKKDNAHIRGTIFGSLIVALPVSVVVAFLVIIFSHSISASFFNGDEFTTTIRIFAITVPLMVAARLFNAATQGLHYMHYTAIRNAVEPGLRFVFTGIAFLLGWRLGGVLAANVLAVVIVTILSFYFLKRVIPFFSKKGQMSVPLRSLTRFSFPMGVSSASEFMLVWQDTLLLGYFGAAEDVGFYSVAIRLMAVLILMQRSFAIIFGPVISDLLVRNNHDELSDLFKWITRWIVTFSLLMFVPIFLFPADVLRLFGENFTIVAGSLIILTVGQLINISTGPVNVMISMSGKSRLEMFNSLSALAINFILCFILIPRWGIIGAASANATALAFVNIIRAVEVFLILDIHAYNRDYLKPLFATASAGIISYFGYRLVPLHGILSLVMGTSVFFAVYVGAIIAQGFDERDLKVVQAVKLRLASAKAIS